jgi:hypothetical protein
LIKYLKITILVALIFSTTNSFAQQKKGTLVIEPEVKELFTMIGPTVTDAIYASQLCDSATLIQCNDNSIRVISYEITIEMNRTVAYKVEGNNIPMEVCTLSKKLRGEEIIYVENIVGIDSSGNKVKLPPVRVAIRDVGRRRPIFDSDEADPVRN